MAKIRSVEDLREHALLTIQKLADGEIEVAEASATGKLCEGVLGTVKAQMEYARMTHEDPNIDFMKVSNSNMRVINGHSEKKLIENKK